MTINAFFWAEWDSLSRVLDGSGAGASASKSAGFPPAGAWPATLVD
jgi:hypothetical protein